jgi:hypothetical protein
MARCLTSGTARFSDAIEIGFETCNDQAVSLAIHEAKVVAVWENSSPLDKGHEWVSPKSKKVIIPNFGHGWKVNTKMGLRRLWVKDPVWHVEDLLTLPAQRIDAQEAAGAPRIHAAEGTLYVSYLRWDDGSTTSSRGWQICTKAFDGERWISVDGSARLIQKQRVRPAVLVNAAQGQIHTFGQSAELEQAT